MSQQLINRSADLKRLLDDGYEIDVRSGFLLMYNVPYVNPQKQVRRGVLVSSLDLAGDVTATPSTHVAMFAGEHPCDRNGSELEKIKLQSDRQEICEGLVIDHSFSSKPISGDYKDYYHKMVTYVAIIAGHAEALDSTATAQTRRVIASDDPDSIFNYVDTASSRAGITTVSNRLHLQRVAIIGLGGTGSYILDLVAKTWVREIHIFDGDEFLQHNAFRAPGAPSIEELRSIPKKVTHHSNRYAKMRKGIISHDFHIDASNVSLLKDMEFVFLCVDKGNVKLPIIEKLEDLDIPFIDVGMGIELADDKLLGVLRVTTSTPMKRDHIRERNRIGFSGGDDDGIYSRNIQIAELNALNAALAVIKWKKLAGFYLDLEHEHFSTYTLDGNVINNEDKV